ncbi:hypothetical protein KP509_10G021700 [Ceratopteris richardii]|uniref:Dystrophia myotonica WD repeat-containing protein n=1 Tax=Ceratopteris richardii TaxID=49495 RepID=A0A8T2TZT8_CERRI|nr:hypothetical protein KP509_10G021700 [Ceratopteris richardii]
MCAMATSSSQSPAVKPNFKTPEGRYKLSYEKTHSPGLHYGHAKAVTQLTVAYLKERHLTTPSVSSSSLSASSSVKMVTQRFLGSANGVKNFAFGGGNTTNKLSGGYNKLTAANLGSGVSNGPAVPSYDGEGTYMIFNVGDTLFISDYNSHDKDPIKAIIFSNGYPICHAFDSESKDGHDLLVGMSSGDVYSVSLRQQLQDPGKKLVAAMHYNKDGTINNSRCTALAWVPQGDGLFVAAHSDGNLYVYDKSKEGSGDASFPPVKEPTQFLVVHARSSKSNPLARWHICQGSINGLAFSADGMFLATVGRDGYLRIFEFKTEQLICGGKSYFGALLCCAWSMDSKYILTGGEDDLVQVWSMEDRTVVAWAEGHNSWVSGVAFDSFWKPPSEGNADGSAYRFGSVGQDTQLLLWDLSMDEIVVPLRRLNPSGSSPRGSNGSGHSNHWDNIQNRSGVLQPPPMRREIPKLSPIVAHRVHVEPLSGLTFTKDAILTVCHEGHVKVWARPDTQEKGADGAKENNSLPTKTGNSQTKR